MRHSLVFGEDFLFYGSYKGRPGEPAARRNNR